MRNIEDEETPYNELLVIDADPDEHTCDVIAAESDVKLLFVKEREFRSGNAYCLRRELFRISAEEYLQFLGIAALNTRLQRALSKGTATLEVRYKGKHFTVGSSMQHLIHHKECSVRTADTSLAAELNFNSCDKSDYEKTLSIEACDAVRITHKDAKSEAVLVQLEFSPLEFQRWLDALQQQG